MISFKDYDEALKTIEKHWGRVSLVEILNAIEASPIYNGMTASEFMANCTCCGGNWTAMLLTGIEKLAPEVYACIPEDMGETGFIAFECLCRVLQLMGIDTSVA